MWNGPYCYGHSSMNIHNNNKTIKKTRRERTLKYTKKYTVRTYVLSLESDSSLILSCPVDLEQFYRCIWDSTEIVKGERGLVVKCCFPNKELNLIGLVLRHITSRNGAQTCYGWHVGESADPRDKGVRAKLMGQRRRTVIAGCCRVSGPATRAGGKNTTI